MSKKKIDMQFRTPGPIPSFLALFLVIQFAGCFGYSDLARAIRNNDVSSVRDLLREGADPNAPLDSDQATALHIAARYDRSEIIQVLIDNGADKISENRYGRTPLHYAARSGGCASITTLVENGVSPNQSEGLYTPLMQAAGDGRAVSTSCLLNLGARLDVQDGSGFTALMHAVWSFNPDTVKVLLDAGADISVRNAHGDTALEIAKGLSRANSGKIAKLIEVRSEVNERF